MEFILGKKLIMTQIFDDRGRAQPVTLIQAGPCTVTQILAQEQAGYNAVQIGFGSKKLNKPQKGHIKDFVNKSGRGFAYLREFRLDDIQSFKKGDILDVSRFAVGDKVNIRGTTKGKGFQGVVKRWNFAGGPKSHGQKHSLRAPGSIGSAYPQRVLKGKKMGGHMGVDTKSILNLKVIYVDKETNVLGVKGAVPGNRGKYIEIVKK